MNWKKSGIIIVMCFSIGMATTVFANVKEDLSALEKEAGIDADNEP